MEIYRFSTFKKDLIYNRYMMENTRLISATWIILLFIFDKFKDVDSTCPSLFSIEKGHNATIGCNITDIPSSTFWYIGSPSHTNPILSLSNNQKSGTMYGNSRFDISSHGDMLIFNARVEDEATYTVVYFRRGGNHQQENITVEIRVHPNQQCPEIAGCTSCSNCDLKINQTGELTCSVSGSRPKLSLQWEIRHIDYLQFTSHQSQSEKDDVTGTWNSKIYATYSFSKCGALADIRCLVQDNPKLIEQSFSDITLSADSCPTKKPGGDPPVTKTFLQPGVIISLVVVCLVLILMVSLILLVITIKKKRQKHGRQLQNIEEDEMGQKPMKTGRQGNEKQNQQADHKILIIGNEELQSLSESYKQHCYITLFAGKEVKKVDIDTLFVESQCIVKWKNGSYHVMTTDELMTHKEIQNEKSVILTGDLGFGKTTFFRQMINKWTQQKEKTFALIYIQLNEHNYQKNIIDIVVNEIHSLHRKDVENILFNESVVVLIDALSELSLPKDCNDISTHYSELLDRIFSVQSLETRKGKKARRGNIEADQTHEELQPINDTISDKLDDIRIRNTTMRTWIALRQTNISFPPMPVKIELVGLNEEQTRKLEAKIFNYRHQFGNNRATNQEKNSSTATEKGGQLDKMTLNLKPYQVKEEKSLLRYVHIIKRFPNVPLFVTTLSYKHNFEKKIDLARTMSKIAETIIECMARHYDTKQRNSNEKTTNLSLGPSTDDDVLQLLSKTISKSVTELEQILGKDKVEKAFAVGLLHKATNDDRESVTFRYPFVEGLFREYHLLQKFESGNFSLDDDDDESLKSDHFRLALSHFCGLQDKDPQVKALKTLREKGMWDDFIDCLSELKDPEKRGEEIGRINRSEELTVTNLDDVYHQANLEAFLMASQKLNYFDGTLILDGQFRVAFLTRLTLPHFVRIVFSNVKIEENDISFIVEWMLKTITPTSSNKTRTFQFHECFINLNRVQQALKRKTNLPGFYIEITSGLSWKYCNTKQTTYTNEFVSSTDKS